MNSAIPDNSSPGVNDTVTINDGLRVEHVEVYVDIDHTYRGDLIITLTSPSGTESTLARNKAIQTTIIEIGCFPPYTIGMKCQMAIGP
ncbi:MAG: hypothetical protein Ct9H90mP16_08180 [Candidatus Poseidoniales archaeon]|nr:MAG: hypothetical protein Ct9H90mP16_08180 [Candidatus Poseidoniales archaeon]